SSRSARRAPGSIRGALPFLRQDFSVSHTVAGPGPRPAPVVAAPGARPGVVVAPPSVRFDYVVRTRVLSKKETALLQSIHPDRPGYPQRDAVLFALRELTGEDPGA